MLLAVGDASLHGVECAGEFCHFATALYIDRLLVVAITDPAGRLHQRIDRPGDRAGQQQAADDRQTQCDHAEQQHRVTQVPVGAHDRIERFGQQDLDTLPAGNEWQQQRNVFGVARADAHDAAGIRSGGGKIVQQACAVQSHRANCRVSTTVSCCVQAG